MATDCRAVWKHCLKIIRDNVGEQSYNTWFEPIVPLRLEGHELTIQVPSQFFYEWLEEHYVSLLRHVVDVVLGPNGKLEYSIIVDGGNEHNKPYTINLPTSRPKSTRRPEAVQEVKTKKSKYNGTSEDTAVATLAPYQQYAAETCLNDRYTFDTYVEGDCNRLARSAGLAVAARPGTTSFNPLMIYGGVGLGKTHLVQAIGNKIKEDYKDKVIFYVSSEKFTNQFIEAVKNNGIQEFTNFYLGVDALIIDDVQFLAGKERTQEIFFHIFNHLQQNSRQIIMTSDCPPRDLKGMQERLISRFKWGLTADLSQPDFETRVAIIQKKMQTDGIDVPYDVVEFLASKVQTNIRELEGVMISMIAQSSLNRKDFDIDLAKHILQNIVQNIETGIDIEYIQKSVSDYFKVPADALKAKTRKKEVVMARQVAMYFTKEFTDYSLKSIGQFFGGRDHSTVIHAIRAVKDLIETNRKFRSSMDELNHLLKQRGKS
ncbi:chromosomal replication initiator protein [Catalinimonas alkaloidigena]|uniref:Chromosomal replication initiator protein DnaA n=1 Tax=Catalinimonas alkaloidigena TaxID=1075417 RepID=A0A1G9DAK8_9BACT|nr:chromosomal replication initiator protein DnaA [Catalinimonas alkaloidigena]SDK60919.1 chromosomal replication initiator protein [Catalinimonas alkaloidigena]